MKLNNDFVILDLEATSNQVDDVRPEKQENNFIIEIGAVYVNSKLEAVSKFSSLVKPEEPVTPFITKITGIKEEDVSNKPKWDVVANQFEEWVRDNSKNIKNVRLCAWGNYFDMNLLRKVYEYYGLKFPFSGTMFDIKTVAMMYCGLSGEGTRQLSVSHVSNLLGIKPDGQYHRALTDADNTARIFTTAMKDLRDGHFLKTNDSYRYLRIE